MSGDGRRARHPLAAVVSPGGHALVCLNAPELDTAFLQRHMQEQAPSLELVQRLPNPAAFADIAPERALKVLVYRMPEG